MDNVKVSFLYKRKGCLCKAVPAVEEERDLGPQQATDLGVCSGGREGKVLSDWMSSVAALPACAPMPATWLFLRYTLVLKQLQAVAAQPCSAAVCTLLDCYMPMAAAAVGDGAGSNLSA